MHDAFFFMKITYWGRLRINVCEIQSDNSIYDCDHQQKIMNKYASIFLILSLDWGLSYWMIKLSFNKQIINCLLRNQAMFY